MTTVTDELIDMAYSTAKSFIESDPEGRREAIPTALLYGMGEVHVLPMPWANDAEKDGCMRLLRRVCLEPEVEAYALVSEVWTVIVPGEGTISVMPSDHPDRQEALHVTAQERGHKMVVANAPIMHEADGRRSLGPCTTEEFDGYAGRMANLFEPMEATH